MLRRARKERQEHRLWSDAALHASSLGCGRCPERSICGGLQVRGPIFDCLSQLCCNNPERCDVVCRRKPIDFAERLREIGGFSFDNVPRTSAVAGVALPAALPVLYHASHRERRFRESAAVGLSLYAVVQRFNGSTRFADRSALASRFQFGEDLPIVLTGTAVDPPLERWWSMGTERRLDAIRALRNLGISLVTTPNFSVFSDQPRWDDLHSMKRIALTHEEFLREGVLAALHINARTDRDWERYREYIAARAEVTHIAFEFGTGAGWAGRIDWYARQLVRLSGSVGRPLHLIVRGGVTILPYLAAAFAGLTVLDTTTAMKTSKRQRAGLTTDGSVTWTSELNAPLDNLLQENWAVVAASYELLLKRPVRRMAASA